MITAPAIIFAVNVFTSILKRWVAPKYGKVGVQVVAFTLALLGAAFISWKDAIPGLEAVVYNGIAIFSLAVAFYEVLLSYLPWFKAE